MGFLSNIISSAVKVAASPIAAIKDGVDVAQGKDPENTKKLLKSAGKDFEKGIDNLMGE